MAPKLMLPVDFGIENLKCDFHNNVVFKLQGGEEMKANSLILSFHSSEFVRLFLELNQSVLEMDDFSKESVKSFLEALYSGEIQLDRNLFRDVNKMCHVFKVDWFSRRCGEYFEGLVGDISPSTDYQTLLFLFEEARFSLKVMKCDKMMDMVVQKICRVEDTAEIFAERYMENYGELELGTDQLDMMLQFTKNNPGIMLKVMKNQLESDDRGFDDVSRYVLKNIDLCRCFLHDELLFEETFDLLDNKTNSCDQDALFVNKLYRNTVKKIKKNKESPREKNYSPSEPTSLSHIFCSLDSFLGLSPQEYFLKMKESPLVLNLYMFIEGMLTTYFHKNIPSRDMVHEIQDTRRKRSWSRVSPEFLSLDFCSSLDEPILKSILTHSSDLTSDKEGVRRVGKLVGHSNKISRNNTCRVIDLFQTPMSFAFYLKHPTNTRCDFLGKCGFLLIFQPEMKSGQPWKFKVDLCLDKEKYPNGLHIHPELIKSEKIHLTLSCYNGEKSVHCHSAITWNEYGVRNTFLDEESVKCLSVGSWELEDILSVKMTAFVTF